jgi:ABC-type transport system involved in multi-copper enzyme maturation permease subunit
MLPEPAEPNANQGGRMDSPALLYALRWLVRDTFRQAIAGKVFWILLGISALAIVFCLGVSVESGVEREYDFLYSKKSGKDLTGPNPEPGTLSLLFGAFKVNIARGETEEVHMIQVLMGTWVAGTVGLLLTLIWTAGFLPEFLQPSAASVLLAKPAPAWLFLLGKYLGVVLFVALQTIIFFFGTWIALGVKTNVWTPGYLAGIPLLVCQFAGLYAFSVLVAVMTRSPIACVLAILLFWAVCLGLNYGRHSALALRTLEPTAQLPRVSLLVLDLSYWVLPKPADMLLILEDSLGAEGVKTTLSGLAEFRIVKDQGQFLPFLSIASTGVFVALMLSLAAYQLTRTDY